MIMASVTFIDKKAAQQFLCAICLDVINQPVQIKCVRSHVFCKVCIGQLIRSKPHSKCPICATIFNPVYNVEIPFIARQINALRVRCNHHPPITINIDQNNMSNNNIPSLQIVDIIQQIENPNNHKNKDEKPTLSGKKRKSPDDENEDDDILILNNRNNPKRAKFDMTEFCEWIGCYGDLNNHIKQCQFELIQCKYCKFIGTKIKRKDMGYHLNVCQYAPVSCRYCKENNILRINLTNHTLFLCEMTEIKCVQCGDKMIRKVLENHIKSVCGETWIECKYMKYGCFMMKRKDKDQHNKEYMEKHLNLIEKSHDELRKSHSKLVLNHSFLELDHIMLKNNFNELRDRLDKVEKETVLNRLNELK